MILAIDANAIIHRAFHAFPPNLVTTSGVQVNAVYGFTAMLLSVLEQFDPQYIFCAFDTSKPTFRHTKFADYKAHRKPTDKSLIAQFPIVEEVLDAFNIPIIKKEGYEADDILGTVAKWVDVGKWQDYGLEMVIVSGDRDLLQLIRPKVKVALPEGSFKNLQLFDDEGAFEKYGYYPSQVTDYKALVGDASDNIPGVKGIGDKSVIEMLGKYKTLTGIYENISELKPRQQKLLAEGVEQAQFSKELATIEQDIDLGLALESATLRDYDREEVLSLFQKLEFRSLVAKLPVSSRSEDSGEQMGMFGGADANKVESAAVSEDFTDLFPESVEIDSKELGNAMSGGVKEVYILSLDGSEVVGVVDNSGKLSYIYSPIAEEGRETESPQLFAKIVKMECETIMYNSERYFNASAGTNGGDVKFDTLSCTVIDLKLAAFHMSSGLRDYSLGSLIFNEIGKNVSDQVVSAADALRVIYYAKKLADSYNEKFKSYKLGEYAESRIGNVSKVYPAHDYAVESVIKGLEPEVAHTLARMEKRGIHIDGEVLGEFKEELQSRVEGLQKEVYEAVGHEFNLNSPKQLGEVLFDELQLPGGGRAKSTREEVLHTLKDMHPAIAPMMQYREASKVLGTYVNPFEEILKSSGDGCIHTDFVQTGASSGRFASLNPNLQNIPARGELATKVRKFFIPTEGFYLASFDYSQIEYRIIADASADPVLIKYFEDGQDIHKNTAARLFKVEPSEVSSAQRSIGKTVNFGILYGQTKYGLSRMLNISADEADNYIKTYYQSYQGVADYMNRAVQEAQVNGYVESMFGRRRYVGGLNSANSRIMNAAVREAINMPMQGSAADIMKLAMVLIQREIDREWKGKVFLLLQIHDEFVLEVEKGMIAEVAKRIDEIMENCVEMSLPLKVGWGYGENLAQIKD